MNSRMLWRIALTGALWASAVNAQVCEDGVLYDGYNTPGQMENSTRTFPEAPEWTANWGDYGEMKAPYIRLSGMNNVKADWVGALEFASLPKNVQGGTLRLKVRSTQNAKFGVWLSGPKGTGSVVFKNLPANSVQNIEVPVEELLGNGLQSVEKVWIGLFGVPAYQYTTIFVDDVALSCIVAGNVASTATVASVDSSFDYTPTTTVASSPVRDPYCLSYSVGAASAAYTSAERKSMADSTSADFVLSTREHEQIQESLAQVDVTPAESRKLWYRNLFYVDRNRLQDSVIANPKAVFDEAVAFAAANDYAFMPLLVADVEYAYRVCQDSSCSVTKLDNARLMQAGLPSSFVRGSKLKLVYDPYFAVTQKSSLPSAEICVGGVCKNMSAGGSVELEFESAGVQTLDVKLRAGAYAQTQKLYVEVK